MEKAIPVPVIILTGKPASCSQRQSSVTGHCVLLTKPRSVVPCGIYFSAVVYLPDSWNGSTISGIPGKPLSDWPALPVAALGRRRNIYGEYHSFNDFFTRRLKPECRFCVWLRSIITIFIFQRGV